MDEAYREDLAYIHDAGFGRIARGAAALLLAELHGGGINGGLVIDLGCGSGILSEQLSAHGFDVLGIDISPAFIAMARWRVPSGEFRVESMLTAELPACVAVAAVGEGLNYLFDDRHSSECVRRVLGRAFAALHPGGLLLFDVAQPGRVPGGKSQSYFEGEDWTVLVSAEEDAGQRLLTRRITSFRKVGDLYRRDHEVHRQRLLPGDEVASWLRETGLEMRTLDRYGTVSLSPRDVGFLARKPG
jgi:SAM-dependent methyltransferase